MTGNNASLAGIQLAAALAEEIYRRGTGDDPISISSDLGASAINHGILPGLELVSTSSGDQYYYSSKGFVGRVVEKDGTVYVVFRGTDAVESFATGVRRADSNGALSDIEILDQTGMSDFGDWATNVHLGAYGAISGTQLDDALLLTRAAKQYALDQGLEVKVVGQSLGGGLAGLVSAIEDVEGYAIAPAPFKTQLSVEATIKTLSQYGITRQDILGWQTFIYIGAGGSEYISPLQGLRDGGPALQEILRLNMPQWSESQIDNILAMRDDQIVLLNARTFNNLEVHTIDGEILSSGLGALGPLGGANHFTIDNQKGSMYNLGGKTAEEMFGNAPVALHGSALHNLVIRTEEQIAYGSELSKEQKLSELIRNNEYLRYGLIVDEKIGGVKQEDRLDPDVDREHFSTSIFGGSGVKSSNGEETAAILFRTLWKSVGIEGGFYDKFYTAFSRHMSSDAVQNDELRKGLTFLGLQVIRDGLRDSSGNSALSETAANPFELAGLTNGAGVDLNHIQNAIVDGLVSEGVYGYLEASDGLKETLRSYLALTQLDQNGVKIKLDLSSWRTFVHASKDGSLIYLTDESRKDSSHAIVGGSGDDFIVASNANDIIIANGGTNHIAAGAGDDYIIGGTGRDVIFGEDGNDTIIAGFGSDQYIDGGNGNDYIVAVGAGRYYGGAGDDTFVTSRFYTTSGNRDIDGGTGYDIAYVQNLQSFKAWSFSVAGELKYGFRHGPTEVWEFDLFKYGGTNFTNIDEFRVGWTFNHTTETWSAGSFGQTYLKDDLYRLLLTGDNRQTENFSDVSYAVVSSANFAQSGTIVIFQGTIAGSPNDYVLLKNDGAVIINGKVYPLKAAINGTAITLYIDIPEPITFQGDAGFAGDFVLHSRHVDPETGQISYEWDGAMMRFKGVISTSLAANPLPIPPIGEIFVSGGIIANPTDTFSGIVFNTENYHSSSSIEWRIISAHGDDFYILPNGELHSFKPLNLSSGVGLKIVVQAFDGTTTVTQKFSITSTGVANLIEGTDAADVIYDTAGNDSIVGGAGNDIIWSRTGYDRVDAGDGDDIIMIGTYGSFQGGNGNDVFDISSMNPNDQPYMRGSINGGSGYDILYMNSLADFDFRIASYGAELTANGFFLIDINEFRLGWNFDQSTMSWSTSSKSSAFNYEDLVLMGLRGEIKGINSDWETVHTSIVEEAPPHVSDVVTIFSGTLNSGYSNMTISSVRFWLSGVEYDATLILSGNKFDVKVFSPFISDIVGDKYFNGSISFWHGDQFPALKTITFGGKLIDSYSGPNIIHGTNSDDVIYGDLTNDVIYGYDGDDIIYASGGYDVVYGGRGNDTLIATDSVAELYGEEGDDTFDISNVTPGATTGILDGGTGHDIVYVDYLYNSKLTLTGGQTVNLFINGFAINDVEEFRVGWEKDANGIWSETAYSQTLSYWDLFAKAAVGEIEGINQDWINITVAAADESLEYNGDRVVVFQGELRTPLAQGVVPGDTLVNINGINYLAQASVNNNVWTITLPKLFIFDVPENRIFNGEIYLNYASGDYYGQKLTFSGLIRDVYDLSSGPTEIIGDYVITASELDVLDSYNFSVDRFIADKPITWSISGEGSQFFTISSDGKLSSIGKLYFSSPYSMYDITIHASDGFKTISKSVYIEPLDFTNIMEGTAGNDLLLGTFRNDIMYGFDGNDILYARGGYDILYGGAGNDILKVLDGYADMYGEEGDDILIGGDDIDYLYGGDGDDLLHGGGHRDEMWGGAGADIFAYMNVTDSDYWDLDRSDRIHDLEDDDSFDFTEMGDISFDWDNGPAGSIYVEVNWQPNKNYGFLSIDVDRDGEFDMAIDFHGGDAGLTQINFVNGPTYYLDDFTSMRSTSTAMARLVEDDLFASPVVDNAPDVYHQYQWAA